MIGKIIANNDNQLKIELTVQPETLAGLINTHVKIYDDKVIIIGEILNIDKNIANVNLVGQIVDNKFVPAVINSPSFSAAVTLIDNNDLQLILGKSEGVNFTVGNLPLYNNIELNIGLNGFLSNHFAVFGNTGSGKSCSVSRLIQNMFSTTEIPYRANIFIFDAYGEYKSAFDTFLENRSPYLKFKALTTNVNHGSDEELLKIPLWLLNTDDLALLLNATESSQLEVIKKANKLVKIFAANNEIGMKYKNDIIARSILSILGSGNTPAQIRDQVFAVLTNYNTTEFNLDSKVVLPGYTRSLRQCFLIDASNKINDIQLITEYIGTFKDETLENININYEFPYNLNDFRNALNFALIAEGIFESDKVFDYANILKVRLDALLSESTKEYFDYNLYVNIDEYMRDLLFKDGKKAQIINFNISHVDDRLGKSLAKIYSRILFDYATKLKNRASMPFHIIVEEAHRYIQNDNDIHLLGYNIFDRITKEGRKYGVILGLISQRPSELSETAVSQCTNFLILRMYHPKDLSYIKDMVPNISEEIVKKLKTLHPGTCIAFGSSFSIPFIVKLKMPDPRPTSISCDVEKIWYFDKFQ